MAPLISPCEHAGVEIQGLELRNLSEADFFFVKDKLFQHGVIFLRDQVLSPVEHIKFAKRLGDVNVNRFFASVAGHPEIAEVLKEKDQKENIGETFHTDHSYDREPALGSVLVARELPKHGGDTLFVDMYKAYETLPNDVKEQIAHMNAVHSSTHVFKKAAQKLPGRIGGADAASQVVVHPVALTHPESGRKVLYVNPTFTVHFEGMSVADSRPLLEFLYHHAASPEHLHRFQWSEGSVAIWDNRATWHSAINDYHGERRLMHRVTVEGCKISDLNSPDRVIEVDADVEYDPRNPLYAALMQRALGQAGAQASRL
jgi:taurine dioxygenase